MEQHFHQTLKRNEELQASLSKAHLHQQYHSSAFQEEKAKHSDAELEKVCELQDKIDYLQKKWIKYKAKLKHSDKKVTEENDALKLLVSQLHHRIEEAEFDKKLLRKDLEAKDRVIQERNLFIQRFFPKEYSNLLLLPLNN